MRLEPCLNMLELKVNEVFDVLSESAFLEILNFRIPRSFPSTHIPFCLHIPFYIWCPRYSFIALWRIPWVPEVFLARFPVSVMSVLETRAKNSCRRLAKRTVSFRCAREKASATQGIWRNEWAKKRYWMTLKVNEVFDVLSESAFLEILYFYFQFKGFFRSGDKQILLFSYLWKRWFCFSHWTCRIVVWPGTMFSAIPKPIEVLRRNMYQEVRRTSRASTFPS